MKLQQDEGDTPLLDALERHARDERVSLHVPGHHQGRLLPGRFDAWFGQAAKLDATELVGLDNLHRATGPIRRSQQLAARYYGASDTFYSVNGSTAGVIAAVAACVEETGARTVVVAGPCHMSLWRALVHADAVPVLVSGNWLPTMRMVIPPTPAQLQAVLRDTDGVAAVFATSPSYQGTVAPIDAYATYAHERAIPLIVDEAHGAHFGLHPELPDHSVAHGADIVVQSPHKTLPCVTQAAWVHVQGSYIRSSVLERHLLFLQTTSPSYVLLAALDAAQAWLRTCGKEAADVLLDRLRPHMGHLQPPGMDPFRWWIPMPDAAQSERFEATLRAQGIYLEYADDLGALAIFGFGQADWEIERFFHVAERWLETNGLSGDQAYSAGNEDFDEPATLLHGHHTFVMTPREVFHARKEHVLLDDACGRISGAAVSPYPPGVPFIWPGEEVTRAQIKQLQAWLAEHRTLVGLGSDGRMEVVSRGA